MKNKVSKGIAIVLTIALAVGIICINPFAGMIVNAETVDGFVYNGVGTMGVDVYRTSVANPDTGDAMLTELFTIEKDGIGQSALCVDPLTVIGIPSDFVLETAGEVDDRVAKILETVNGSTDPVLIAGAQAAMWAIVNLVPIQTTKTVRKSVTVPEHYEDEFENTVDESNVYLSNDGNYYLWTVLTPLTMIAEVVEHYEDGMGNKVDARIHQGTMQYKDENNNWQPATHIKGAPEYYVLTSDGITIWTNVSTVSRMFKNSTGTFGVLYENRILVNYVQEANVMVVTEEPYPYKAFYDAFMIVDGTTRAQLMEAGSDIAFADGTKSDDDEGTTTSQRLITLIPYTAPVVVTDPPVVVITSAPVALADAGEVLGATRRVGTEDMNSNWIILFGISSIVLTGFVLKKKKDSDKIEETK